MKRLYLVIFSDVGGGVKTVHISYPNLVIYVGSNPQQIYKRPSQNKISFITVTRHSIFPDPTGKCTWYQFYVFTPFCVAPDVFIRTKCTVKLYGSRKTANNLPVYPPDGRVTAPVAGLWGPRPLLRSSLDGPLKMSFHESSVPPCGTRRTTE